MFLKANKYFPVIIIFITVCFLFLLNYFIFKNKTETDNLKINEIIYAVEEASENGNYLGLKEISGYDFVVTNFNGDILYIKNADNKTFMERKNEAVKSNQLVMAFSGGYIFIDTEINGQVLKTLNAAKAAVFSFLISFSAIMLLYYLYFYLNLIRPFKKLKDFAAEVAAGNLNSPLFRNRLNYFGLFTESFDIMREELKKAKIETLNAEKSKKELVAQISHDIKTPVSSIKAVTEIMQVTAKSDKERKNIELITLKTNEIDRLISDLFSSTLNDLSELKMRCGDFDSKIVKDIIEKSDIKGKLKFVNEIPSCLIYADELRLTQVFDNIIANSYKYADTEIEVSFNLSENFVITVRDFGKGVSEEELPLLTNKFYRGSNSKNTGGAGLGLSIASDFMKKMGGGIELINLKDGFMVKVIIKLST